MANPIRDLSPAYTTPGTARANSPLVIGPTKGAQTLGRVHFKPSNINTGIEASPRWEAGVAGDSLTAIKADPVLKAGTGNISGSIAAVQANIDFGVSGTRTISGDVSAFESFLAVPSTYTYSGAVSFMRVRTVNIKAWTQFLNLDDGSTGVDTAVDPSASTQDRWLRVLVGATQYYLRLYTA